MSFSRDIYSDVEWQYTQFYQWMQQMYLQGEHVCIVGPTGTGKTTIASDIVQLRRYVCVLAVKRFDSTLDLFKAAKFKVLKKWPPEYGHERVVLWVKPDSLEREQLVKQAATIHDALSKMYISGGWTVYFDETGYIAGVLGLSSDLGILLNQGRSSFLSVVCCMTRPHSMVARIPSETLNQCRHVLIFKYTDEREIKATAEITGINLKEMKDLQARLGAHDFIYTGKGQKHIVRNIKRG